MRVHDVLQIFCKFLSACDFTFLNNIIYVVIIIANMSEVRS